MSVTRDYVLRWRGRQSGPYTLEQINRLLDDHEIGMGHEIEYQNNWITLEEFLETVKSPAKSPAPSVRTPVTSPPVAVAVTEVAPARSAPNPSSATVAAEPLLPPPAASMEGPAAVASAVRPRHRVIYALLAFLLGFSGVHNFYARHWLTGVVQFLVSCASFLLGFGIIVPWLWALVEAILVRKDGSELDMT